MNIVDIIIVVLMLTFALFGYFGNPLKTIKSFVSFTIAFILSSLLLNPLVNLISNLGYKENVYTPLVIYTFLIIIFWGLLFSLLLPALPKLKTHTTFFRIIGFIVGAVYGLIFAVFLGGVLPQFLLSQRAIDLVYSSQIVSVIKKQPTAKAFKSNFLSSISPKLTQAILAPEEDKTVLKLEIPQNAQSQISSNDAAVLFRLINDARSKANREPLQQDSALDALAQNYAKTILLTNYFAHRDQQGKTPDDRAKAMQIKFDYFGENLAFAPTILVAHEGLMNSSGHRANIESPVFRRVGVAVLDVKYFGKIVVEEFAN